MTKGNSSFSLWLWGDLERGVPIGIYGDPVGFSAEFTGMGPNRRRETFLGTQVRTRALSVGVDGGVAELTAGPRGLEVGERGSLHGLGGGETSVTISLVLQRVYITDDQFYVSYQSTFLKK